METGGEDGQADQSTQVSKRDQDVSDSGRVEEAAYDHSSSEEDEIMNQLLKKNLEHVLKHKIKNLLVAKEDEVEGEEQAPEPWVRETMNLDKNICRMDKEPKRNYARVRNEPLEKRA